MKARALPAGGRGEVLRPNHTSAVLEVSAAYTPIPVSKQSGGAPGGRPLVSRLRARSDLRRLRCRGASVVGCNANGEAAGLGRRRAAGPRAG